MTARLILVSHPLCPYVQRAAIVLAEKGVAFERRDVDPAQKSDWFRAISPLGKTPVLLIDGTAVFEPAVICEYLDETLAPQLHPADALERARHRSWMAFGSAVLNGIAALSTTRLTRRHCRPGAMNWRRASCSWSAHWRTARISRGALQHGRRGVRAGVSPLRRVRDDRRRL